MRCFSVALLLVSFTALRLSCRAAGASVWYFSRAFARKLEPSIVLGNKLAASLVQVLQTLQMLDQNLHGDKKSSDWIRWRSRWVCRGQSPFYGTNYQQHTTAFIKCVKFVDLCGLFMLQFGRPRAAGPCTVWRNRLFVYIIMRRRTFKGESICSCRRT